MAVYRAFVEKKQGFDVEAQHLLSDLRQVLGIEGLLSLRLLCRYDVESVSEAEWAQAVALVLSEPQLDDVYDALPQGGRSFAVEYLPGQYDQRADAAAQCIALLTGGERPQVRTAKAYILEGELTDADFAAVKHYLINPVEAREASPATPDTLTDIFPVPDDVARLAGFTQLDSAGLRALHADYGLAMDLDDLAFVQGYFRDDERRDPTVTELRVIDTYWSDHCRHTTFLTHITDVAIDDDEIKASYDLYLSLKDELYGDNPRPTTLMDLATIGAKALKKRGILQTLDESDEINACSVRITAKFDGRDEDWLLMFKNETHNHPTEIEPFGGAATCLGGAIRDPLSGRSYVYHAMRVTGASDPREPVRYEGKLSQRKITTTAASGYSAYGNQIGLATGMVSELYHPGYTAKRMEIGAVVGAAPADHVRREIPAPGDVIILLGGRTGRDGIGGATGSSKSHSSESLTSCGAEVQKGNPVEERKIQRLFRDPAATRLIKKCNDFGAGGVCVAIGELADGLRIELDAVRKKYEGLDATELAISESQERMAVVVAAADAQAFIALAARENLEAYQVATVQDDPRLIMTWRGDTVLNISRDFLNSNGTSKRTTVRVAAPRKAEQEPAASFADTARALVQDLNMCSQKGLNERFDSSIGAGSVLVPFGGKYALTPTQAMCAKLPALNAELAGDTTTCSMMAWGFDPYRSEASPYHGAATAVVDSLARLVATGGRYQNAYMSFQEYFERLRDEPVRWGKPFAALLGALRAQMELGVGAIGGKDSMSGSFEDLDVPPTLVSFAICACDVADVVTPEFKETGSSAYLLEPAYTSSGLPDFTSLKQQWDAIDTLRIHGRIRAMWAVGAGGVLEGVFKMAAGNGLGFAFADTAPADLTAYRPGAIIAEANGALDIGALLGTVTHEPVLTHGGESADMGELTALWQQPLEPIFPLRTKDSGDVPAIEYTKRSPVAPAIKVAQPRVLIPVFPGNNCEYDTQIAFERYGAQVQQLVIRNLTPQDIEDSKAAFAQALRDAQILIIPGGFSAGDEPEGSGKFITAFLRSAQVREGIDKLLSQQDGLMLGICNGFQALIKLGLVPYGKIIDTDENCPTLTYNTIGRHQARLVDIRVASTLSPWLMHAQAGDIHTGPVSHGEGRFVCPPDVAQQLIANGQIATQYVAPDGTPSMDVAYNPNGAYLAVEGITSADGRVFGRMAHFERIVPGATFLNRPGHYDTMMFGAGVDYFKK